MQKICSKCPREALYFCQCSNPPVLSCQSHCHDSTHPSQDLYYKIDSKEKSKILKECGKAIRGLEKSRKKTLKIVTRMIKKIKKTYENFEKELSQMKKSLVEVIASIGPNPRICLLNQSKIDISLITILNNQKLETKSPLSTSDLLNTLQSLNDSEKLKQSTSSTLSARWSMRNNLPDIISVPIARSNLVKCIEISTLKVHEVSLSGPEFPYEYGFALLPFGQILIYGGVNRLQNKKPLKYLMNEETFLIDPQERSIISVGRGKGKSDMSNGAFFNGEVYVFGGYDEKNTQVDSCEKFSLAEQIWIDISKLPSCIGYTSSVSVVDRIFVAGKFSSKVLDYSPFKNQFSESMKIGTEYKVLLGNGKNAILIEGVNAYLYLDGWNSLGTALPDSLNSILIGPYLLKNNSIYFLTGKFNYETGVITKSDLYQFNLESFQISLLSRGILL